MKFDVFGDCEIKKVKICYYGYEIKHKANKDVNGCIQYSLAGDKEDVSTIYERGKTYTFGPSFADVEAEFDRRAASRPERPQRLNSFVELD